ncbi:MAG TPA: TerC family protein [Patescibacteria group bacterium]|nr:TerC family protein [Patescibacteria group bacterium]
MPNEGLWFVGFNIFVLIMLALDLGVFNRKQHTIGVKEALLWSVFWITLALIFNGMIWHWFGTQKALEFLTGYLIEKSLSVDNLFVFLLVFSYFRVPAQYQHKILFWGIIGALVMRGVLIFVGAALIEQFHWILYIFGAFLVYSGYKMAFHHDDEMDLADNAAIRILKKFIPITHEYHESNFTTKISGKTFATPMLAVLMVIETSDLIFAVDSIPAIFAVSRDPFIVYTSNVFAILGLRSLYFALAGVMDVFHYLKYGLALVLSFIGIKMLIMDTPFKIPTGIALLVVVAILAISVIASLIWKKEHDKDPDEGSKA